MIEECIRSALDQDYKSIEVVVVDNCSTDSTWEICKKIAAIDSRVRAFQNSENVGPVKNWIRCLQESKGVYVKFLFSDDLLFPECVGSMVSWMGPDVGFVFSPVAVGKTKEKSTIKYRYKAGYRLSEIDYVISAGFYRVPVSPGAMLFRRTDALKNLKLDFPTKIRHDFKKHGAGPDIMMGILALGKQNNAICSGTVGSFFMEHEGSFSTGKSSGEVDRSYVSVISWHLKENFSHLQWLIFISLKYAELYKASRSWVEPRKYLREYDGSGSALELITMLIFMPFVVTARFFYVLCDIYESRFKS